jgi:hypothetical protein
VLHLSEVALTGYRPTLPASDANGFWNLHRFVGGWGTLHSPVCSREFPHF